MYLLDTNTLIFYFKGVGQVAQHLLDTPPQDIGLPAIVLFELEVGVAKSVSPRKRLKQLEAVAQLMQVFAFGTKEAKAAAAIRAQLEARGRSIGPLDVLIAGTALANQATLVTHNTGEFERVAGLKIVDWY